MRPSITLLAVSLLAALPALAHGPNEPAHQTHCMGALKLESGEAIRDFCISYVTHGALNATKTNAILMVTAIGGNHHRITKFLDTVTQQGRLMQ